ncbi:MAG: transposase [Hymenobacter sp.]
MRPAVLIEAIRRHWAIENSLHWVLDVVFREDDARSRDRVATRSFAVLRKLAFNLLQQGQHQPGSLRARRRNAGWNDDYMTQLLTLRPRKLPCCCPRGLMRKPRAPSRLKDAQSRRVVPERNGFAGRRV